MKSWTQIYAWVSEHSLYKDDSERYLEAFKRLVIGDLAYYCHWNYDGVRYDDFVSWLETEIAAGDIVKFGKTCGLVHSAQGGVVIICAFLDMNDKLIVCTKSDYITVPVHECQLAGWKEHEMFYMQMSENQLEISNKYVCADKMLVKTGSIWSVKMADGNYIVWADKVVYDGVVSRYYYKENDDMHIEEKIFPHHCLIHQLTKSERDAFEDGACSTINYTFPPDIDVPVKVLPRLPHNKTYYYITDKFTVSSATDSYKPMHSARWAGGNYFYTVDDARRFVESIKMMYNEQIKSGKIKSK